MNPQQLGALMVLLSAAGFATLAIFIKLAYAAGANTLTILTLRFTLASLMLWAILKPMGLSPRMDKKTLFQLFLMGALGYGSMSLLFTLTVQYLPASLAEILLFTYPAIVSILSFILGEDQFSWLKGGALAACLAGLIFILGLSFEGINPLGLATGLGGAMIYSIYILVGNRVLKKAHSLVATTYVCSSAAAIFLLSSLVSGSLILTLPLNGWLSIIGIALFATIVGILAFFMGLTRVGAANASIISTAEPVITVILSVIILGEHLTGWQLVGAGLVVGSIILLQLSPRQESAEVKAPLPASQHE